MNLQEFLPAATVMVVSVTASTTQGLVQLVVMWLVTKYSNMQVPNIARRPRPLVRRLSDGGPIE